MKAQHQRNEKMAANEAMTENLFARSESLMVLYQKEKAKQLYQEQLAIIKQKREYEARLAEMERQHSLERLALSRKEYVFFPYSFQIAGCKILTYTYTLLVDSRKTCTPSKEHSLLPGKLWKQFGPHKRRNGKCFAKYIRVAIRNIRLISFTTLY
jgi:hypothetical protein